MTPAELAAARADDDRSRRVARTEFERPLLLDAGAGTGKTTVVASRIVAWLLGPGWDRAAAALGGGGGEDPDRIARRAAERVVAITFTDRAAAEMAERIARMLACVHRGVDAVGLALADLPGPDDRRRERAAALLAVQDRLEVATIHAFCRRLLAARALEAGLHPAFEVDAEGTLLAGVVEEVMARRLPEALGPAGDERWIELAAQGHGPAALAAALEELATEAVPPEALDDDPLSDARAHAVARELGRRAVEIADLVREPLAGPAAKRLKKGPRLRDALDAVAAAAAGAETAGQLVVLATERLDETLLKQLRAWSALDPSDSDTESAVLAPVARELAPAAGALHGLLQSLRQVDPAVLAPARAVLRPLLAEVEEELRRRGISPFAALIRDAAVLLRSDAVAAAVRREIDQLVVDEFQDTDRLQCEIVRRLALEGPSGERPGLMLVGDPKQSIYGWRHASLAAYREFARRVEQAGGERLPLVVNFRSQPAVLEEVTRIARPLLVEDGDRQAPFQELAPDRPPEPEGARPPVEYWVSWSRDRFDAGEPTRARQAREVEADAVAAEIDALRREGASLGRIAILLRATSGLEPYLAALRARGLPFVVEREREYFRRREVIDAGALVRAIADPLDELALVTFLRSPWGGVPDAALPGLWSSGAVEELRRLDRPADAAFASLDEKIDAVAREVERAAIPGLDRVADWRAAAKAAVRALAELRRSLSEDAADRFVETLAALVLAEEFAAARYLGLHRLANLERFLRRLLDGLSGAEGIQGVLRELRGGVAEGREEREGAPGDDTLDAVRVLTIHKAKGLDFDHVFVVDLHHRTGGHRSGGNRPRGSRSNDNRVAPRDGGGWDIRLLGVPGLGFHAVEREEAEIAAAESVRTLYVAATRARVSMVLAGAWPDPATGRAAPAGSHLSLLARREGGDGLAAMVEAGGAATDAHGVPWRLAPAGDPAAPRPPAAAARAEASAASEAAAVRDLALLADARRDAVARMRRPATATPSGAAHAAVHAPVHAAVRAARDEADEPGTGPPLPAGPAPGSDDTRRDERLAVGTAIHRALEAWDLAADPAAERARQRARLAGYLPPDLSPELRDGARAEAEALLDRMAGNGALAAFAALRGRVLGREVPLLAAPGGDADDQPTGAWVGTIDLLYRAEDGALVVADYKTDALPDPGAPDFPAALAAAVARYRPQLARYVESLRAIFPDPPPRAELWLLAAGRVERA
ncbi:MAG: UvrD-helicase domain-containing protein [Acidobacteria bacterium]|nr:UvrD-helicase domain-containing protein [Acidobacteriota bacterium]